jgi:MoxR-like ATPase
VIAMNEEIKKLNGKAKQYAEDVVKVTSEIKRVIVGQDDIIDKTMIALIANGHVLIEGVPGLAKSLLIKTLSDTLECGFVRLQFTPDLLPADIIGTKIYSSSSSSFSVLKGPIFTNFVLADEINRAPPKVQSALLEAMQERQVSIQGETHKLKSPFLVLATQNPIESEGTYKLPEAQVDRFMFKLIISYPKKEDEVEIIERFTEGKQIDVKSVLTSKQILDMQEFNQEIYADRKIKEYVADIIDATRHPESYKLDLKQYIEYGASPRASIWLILAAKAHAMINGRGYVIPEDVKKVSNDILRHRILLTYEAESEGITSDQMIDQILDKIKVP